jgi:hypothetical protein
MAILHQREDKTLHAMRVPPEACQQYRRDRHRSQSGMHRIGGGGQSTKVGE